MTNIFTILSSFFSKRLQSFGYAFRGLAIFFQTQTNAKIQVLIALFVILLGFLLQIVWYEWALLIFAIGLVLSAEAMNTAIEFLTDLVSPTYNEKAGKVKDIAAGAVLLTAITAILIAMLIFIPKFMRIW
jgi:diacylglycerol kinase (ATP)